jgi:hypothetical protein
MGTYTIPNVVERTPQGERSYDVFSRLLSERIVFREVREVREVRPYPDVATSWTDRSPEPVAWAGSCASGIA